MRPPTATGNIVATLTTNPLGHERVSFSWQGGNVVSVSRHVSNYADPAYFSRDGDILTIGPYRLRVIAFDIDYLADICVLDDWRGWAYANWYRLTRSMEMVYRRVLWTAVVWGLADGPQPNIVPTWCDWRWRVRWPDETLPGAGFSAWLDRHTRETSAFFSLNYI